MCSGPVLRKMIVFTLPIMFSGLFQLLFNATDIIVVGRFAGDNALAAVGSNTALINLMTNLFIGISIGANVVAARYCGAKNYSEPFIFIRIFLQSCRKRPSYYRMAPEKNGRSCRMQTMC